METFAIEADGVVAWRIAHTDVVTESAMVGGRLVLTGYGGGLERKRWLLQHEERAGGLTLS